MKTTLQITLRNAEQVDIVSPTVFQSLVPDQMDGEVLNFGQAEGQLRIEDSVWGFYVDDAGDYSYTLEEGILPFERASAISIGILDQIRTRWGNAIQGEVKGCHHDDPTMRSMV